MVSKIKLIKKESYLYTSYEILVFLNSDKPPLYIVGFPYVSKDKQTQLIKSRKFGNSMAKFFNTKLEENLE